MKVPAATYLIVLCALAGCTPAVTETPTETPTPPTETSTPIALPTETPRPTATEALPVRIVAVGDVLMARSVNIGMIRRQDFTWPFQETAELLQTPDLTLGNLEGPLLKYCRPTDGGDVMCGDERSLEGLTWAGFDVLSLANNHTHDYGQNGFDTTKAFLDTTPISAVYPSNPTLKEVHGIRFAILAFDDSETLVDEDAMLTEVATTRPQADVLIVMMHWGFEYHPTQSNRQTRLGHALVDAGANLVIGSHPHWRQPVEEYGGGIIFYSLGNFVFDQMWSEETRRGNVADITVTRTTDGFAFSYELVPIMIYLYGQPVIEK